MGRLQLRILGLKHPHAEIHSVVRQLPLLQVRGPVGDPDADAGIGFGKVPQNLWDENGGPGRRDSDVQPPGILVRHRLQHREYVALRGHRLLGVGQKQLSLIGELHFRLPLKQLAAAFGFQPRDVAAEILLGEEQTVGGLCKV